MVVWQFATIAALIGALLTYVMVLTNRLGTTNVLLKRIEEGLVRPQPVTENAPVETRHVAAAAEPATARVLGAVRAVEVASVPAAVEVAPAAELEDETAAEVLERDRRVSYLTVRDLKVISRSGRRSSDTPTQVSPLFNEVFGRRHEQAEPVEAPAESLESSEAHEEPMVASVESHEAVVEELAVATYEIRDFLESTPAPHVTVAEPEPVAFEPMTAEPTAAEPVAAIYETVEPSPPSPASPPDIVAANEDQAPAEASDAAATESDAVDAAALEEKRRRDLLMQAQRRRRRLR
jgi:hypothetical protein